MSDSSRGSTAPIDAAVILAGGGGTRLWPWSGASLPKPLLPLGGSGQRLISATLSRLEGLVPRERIVLQAPDGIGRLIAERVPEIDASQLRGEPSPRDTAPAIALAVRRAARVKKDAIVALLPADHRVADVPAFREAMRVAAIEAGAGALVILGVTPTGPSTRFGYVEMTEPAGAGRVAIPVRRFVEKPGLDRARTFAADGRFVWNAGIFVWRADAFWSALEKHAPDIAGPVAAFEAGDLSAWEKARKTSIDYGLMEKAEGVVAVPLDAGWDDVGGWEAVLRIVDSGEEIPGFHVAEMPGTPNGSRLVTAGVDLAGEGVSIGGGAQLVIVGPHGVLAAPLEECDRVKEFL